MNTTTCCTPTKPSEIVAKGLELQLKAKQARQHLKWGAIHLGILAVLLFDIFNKCPYSFSQWYYVEYTAAVLVALSAFVYFLRYLFFAFSFEPIKGTLAQRDLMQFDEKDKSFVLSTPQAGGPETHEAPMNATLLSWHSSFNDSNRMTSANWAYTRCTPPGAGTNTTQNTSWNSSVHNDSSLNTSALSANGIFATSYKTYAKENVVTDERGLQQLLKEEYSKQEYNLSEAQVAQKTLSPTSINSFWNYCNNAATLLKTSLYQLSPSAASPNKQSTKDEGGMFDDGNSEIIKKIPSSRLSQYVANLRMWISGTILQRIEAEINKIDESFKSRGFSDIQIGSVGLERLKKTAENKQFVSSHVPMLPLIVPFLEMSTNQEYLVQRIKDLAKGSCIADYRWNSGSSYHGLNWDEHLPTDSAILFHLFCTYLDSQLMPLPQPGGRPFFNRYVVIGDKKTPKETIAEVKNKSKCAILCTNQLKPKFNFISDDKVHNCAYDRNNLFYVIIQFLIYMKTNHEGLLEGVNLGKSGINILCVIED